MAQRRPAGITADRTDEELLLAVAGRQAEALATLYDRYGTLALALAARIVGERALAEDVVQDAFLTLWRQANTFRPQRGMVRAWLLSIVHHRAIDMVRRRVTAASEPFDLLKHDVPAGDVWRDVAAALTREQVLAALRQLPAEQREAIELAYFNGLTQQEIAQRLAAPLGTIKGRMRLAMQKLKTLLDDLRPGA